MTLTYSQTMNDGDTGDVIASKMATTLSEIRTEVNALADTNLVSPNNTVYKTLLAASAYMGTAVVGTYFVNQGGNYASGATTNNPPVILDFVSGEYAVGSKTTKFRVKMEVMVGATSPSTVTLQAGLYPVTISGGNYTLGTVVTGSTALSSGLSTNNPYRFNSGDFAASALLTDPGIYALGIVVGSITVPAGIAAAVQLQTRNV